MGARGGWPAPARALLSALLGSLAIPTQCSVTWEVQRFDGWYNNLARHPRGAAGSPLMRLLPARYVDGVYVPVREPYLPNPRSISSVVSQGPSGLPSSTNQTVLSVVFGYHVVFEILDSRRPGCPPEFMHITVPKGDAVFDPNGTGKILLPFQRGQWDPDTGRSPNNPRTQVNHVTAWIDGSSIYGSSSSWCDALRSFSGGRLASGSKEGLPKMSSAPYFMWNSVDPTTGQHGRHGLFGMDHIVCIGTKHVEEVELTAYLPIQTTSTLSCENVLHAFQIRF